MYAETTVVVAGAVDEQAFWTDETPLAEYLADLEADAQSDGYRYEVWVRYHEHNISDECECAQYEQDHRPTHVFNEDGNR